MEKQLIPSHSNKKIPLRIIKMLNSKALFILVFLFVLQISATCQITISLNEYDAGDYLGVKYMESEDLTHIQKAILREEPNLNGKVIDTVEDNFSNLIFKIIEANSKNNFVHVRVVRKGSDGRFENDMFILPSSVSDGAEGWVIKSELEKHPVPESFMLPSYEADESLLQIIINNCEWVKNHDSTEYKNIKNTHSKLFLIIGKNYYEKDSLAKAIYYTSNSLKVKPNITAYIVRASAKVSLEDYQGAINDCTKCLALKKKPDFENYDYDLKFDGVNVFGLRGYCFLQLKIYDKALIDLNAAIKEDDTDGQLFYFRAFAKFNSGQNTSACDDLSKAGELGFESAYESIKENCN
jgi:hypothetical protein